MKINLEVMNRLLAELRFNKLPGVLSFEHISKPAVRQKPSSICLQAEGLRQRGTAVFPSGISFSLGSSQIAEVGGASKKGAFLMVSGASHNQLMLD